MRRRTAPTMSPVSPPVGVAVVAVVAAGAVVVAVVALDVELGGAVLVVVMVGRVEEPPQPATTTASTGRTAVSSSPADTGARRGPRMGKRAPGRTAPVQAGVGCRRMMAVLSASGAERRNRSFSSRREFGAGALGRPSSACSAEMSRGEEDCFAPQTPKAQPRGGLGRFDLPSRWWS